MPLHAKNAKMNPAGAYDGREKRRFKRGESHFRVFIHLADNRILASYTDNIGDGGLRAVFEEEVAKDVPLRVEVFTNDDPVICKGTVVWVRTIPSSQYPNSFLYDTGIAFIPE